MKKKNKSSRPKIHRKYSLQTSTFSSRPTDQEGFPPDIGTEDVNSAHANKNADTNETSAHTMRRKHAMDASQLMDLQVYSSYYEDPISIERAHRF